jgi:hypothetical protein
MENKMETFIGELRKELMCSCDPEKIHEALQESGIGPDNEKWKVYKSFMGFYFPFYESIEEIDKYIDSVENLFYKNIAMLEKKNSDYDYSFKKLRDDFIPRLKKLRSDIMDADMYLWDALHGDMYEEIFCPIEEHITDKYGSEEFRKEHNPFEAVKS